MATAPFLHTHCPVCGSEMKYGGRKLNCPSCSFSRKLGDKSDTVAERKLTADIDLGAFERGLGIEHHVYSCCKVKIAVPATLESYPCPFCGDEAEKLDETISIVRPEGIVPFTIPHTGTPSRFQRFVKKTKWFFRAAGFSHIAKAENIRAIYVPVFLFDAFTRSSWKAESGYNDIFPDDYEGKETGKSPNTRWEDSRGYFEHNFAHEIMIAAGTKVVKGVYDTLKIESLTPQIVEAYDPKYVQEFACELYQEDEMKSFEAGGKRMDDQIKSWIIPMVPGDAHRELKITSEKLALSFKHILMPVWVSRFRYRKADHVFYLNGRTGRIHGTPPLSWEKVAMVIIIGVILLILAVLGVNELRS